MNINKSSYISIENITLTLPMDIEALYNKFQN